MKKNKAVVGFSAVGFTLFLAPLLIMCTILFVVYEALKKATDNYLVIVFVLLGLILIFAAIFTLCDLLRRKIMVDKPTKMILKATDEIANGNFSVRLMPNSSIDNYDAYDLIMVNFNKMAEELSKLEMLKTDFVSNVSHEIKTPLAVIQNYASVIAKDGVGEKEKKEYAESISKACKRLAALVGDVLKLNRLENQSILSEKETVNVSELLRQSIIEKESLIDDKEIELICDIDEVVAYTVPAYLEIVWGNLISNAIKFTKKGGKIKITLKNCKDSFIVMVEDNGIGIPKEVGKKVFEKFYQADTSRSGEGNGLGLALVKKVTDVLGGELSVESEVGVGSKFSAKFKKEN